MRFCSNRSAPARRQAPTRLRSPHPTPAEPVMPDCRPFRATFAAPPPSGATRVASRRASRAVSRPRSGSIRATLAERCLRMIGWYRLERLLASIPDSNDDFGIV
ncbi:hypothetical protein DIE16_17395 [Burkholderia sp. Bp9090]|nr:hypothetical protein DIE16_17395 [Burkholderia sp. Bp9090]